MVIVMSTKIYAPSRIKVTVLSIHDEGEYFLSSLRHLGKVFFAHKDQVQELVEAQKLSQKNFLLAIIETVAK